MQEINKEMQEKAQAAVDKKASFARDVDLESYTQVNEDEHGRVDKLTDIDAHDRERMEKTGIDAGEAGRDGTFIQMDQSVVHTSSKQEGIEVTATSAALDKYDWLWDYYWKLVMVDADKFTARTQLKPAQGYFIRAEAGVKSDMPVQSCLYLSKNNAAQNVHNIIIAEEGSELHIITGCTTAPHVINGLHIGVSEFYVKKNAKITFTMIHNWADDMVVRPRTGVLVEEGGVFLSNYISMSEVKSLQMYPTARLVGDGALARFNTVVVCPEGSEMDLGSRVILDAPNTKTEIIARTITTGGNIIARGSLVGNAPDSKGHLECRGLMLSDTGRIHAIPELEATTEGAELSHEAAVGRISQEEIEYLMARGLSEDEATSTIVRGFLNIEIKGLPEALNKQLEKAIEASQEKAM